MILQHNEAACLLEQGALYTRREGYHREGRDLVFAGFKQGAFSLYFGDAPIYHFDLEGRWQRAYLRDRHFIKRLDGTVQEVERVRQDGELFIRRRSLDPTQVRKVDEEIRAAVSELLADLDREQGRRIAPPDGKATPIGEDELRAFLGRIIAWDAAAWDAFDARVRACYGPLPFIPPDSPNAVVVQATLGDRDGCSFAAGPVHDYAARTPEEFDRHVREVAGLLGRRLHQTRTAFLAGADALHLPGPEVLAFLDSVSRGLKTEEGTPAIDEVHAFVDDFQEPIIGPEDLRAAYDRRLTHIAIGVESGAPELRRWYGKDWYDVDLQAFAADAKAAGIELSVLTLVGAGGRSRRSEHVERTRRLIESLLLTRGDLVFLLDERELAASEGLPGGFEPLSEAEWREQFELLRQGLSGLRERGVKVVPYSMVKQFA